MLPTGPVTAQRLGIYGQPSLQYQYNAHADVKQAVTSWLQTLDTYFFPARILTLVLRWNRCSNVSGGYVEVWCAPCAAHVPRCGNNLIGIGEPVALFFSISLVSTLFQ